MTTDVKLGKCNAKYCSHMAMSDIVLFSDQIKGLRSSVSLTINIVCKGHSVECNHAGDAQTTPKLDT